MDSWGNSSSGGVTSCAPRSAGPEDTGEQTDVGDALEQPQDASPSQAGQDPQEVSWRLIFCFFILYGSLWSIAIPYSLPIQTFDYHMYVREENGIIKPCPPGWHPLSDKMVNWQVTCGMDRP